MARRTLKIATCLSTAMLTVMVVLFVAGIWINPRDHHLSLSDTFHVSVSGRGWDIRLVFFNDAEYGPYSGSVIGVVDNQGNVYPPLEREVSFGDTAGIYYRYFRWSGATLWTLMLSLWYPIALFAILPLLWWVFRLGSKSHAPAAPAQRAQLTGDARDE